MKKMICFDMDGTIADFYNVENWLPRIRAEDVTPYLEAEPLWDMEKLNEVLRLLRQAGWEIRIISWLCANATKEYDEAVREAKRAWLNKWGFIFDHFHGVKFGATKADSVRQYTDHAILIDDNEKVREGWHLGETIDPAACNLIEALEALL